MRGRTGAGGLVAFAFASVLTALVVSSCDGTADAGSARGAELFQTNCVLCHGREGGGTPLGPPLVHELYTPDSTPDEDFRVAVQQGAPQDAWEFGDMPATALDDEQVEAVVAHVRDLQREAGLID